MKNFYDHGVPFEDGEIVLCDSGFCATPAIVAEETFCGPRNHCQEHRESNDALAKAAPCGVDYHDADIKNAG